MSERIECPKHGTMYGYCSVCIREPESQPQQPAGISAMGQQTSTTLVIAGQPQQDAPPMSEDEMYGSPSSLAEENDQLRAALTQALVEYDKGIARDEHPEVVADRLVDALRIIIK